MDTILLDRLQTLCDKYTCHNSNEIETVSAIVARQFAQSECAYISEYRLYKEALAIATSYYNNKLAQIKKQLLLFGNDD
jgi:hypothetical protein